MHIIHLISNNTWGGGEQYALDLALRQRLSGHSVTIVSRKRDAVVGRFRKEGFTVSIMPLLGALDPVSPVRLSRLLRKERADMIHAHNFKDAVTAVRARRLAGSDTGVIVTRHQVKRAKTGRFHERLYRNIDSIVFVSALARDVFLESGPKVDAGKLRVIHNGVTLPEPLPMPRGHSSLRLMMHGRLTPEKGIETAIEALAKVRDLDAHLVITGTGSDEYVAKLKALATALSVDDRIEWTGYRSDVASLIADADIGLCPSMCREAFGLAVVEYMAQGKPVITTDNGAQPEYITDGVNGFLVTPGDSDAVASIIRRIADNPEIGRTVGEEASAYYREYLSYDKFYQLMMQTYQSVKR